MAGAPAVVRVEYEGGDRLRIDIRGHQVWTDQPVEDGGGDTAPTPTELFLAGLAGCVAFFAERFLRRNGLSTEGLSVACTYAWAERPHRIGEVELTVEAPSLTVERLEAFTRVVEHCTLHSTLRQPPEVRIRVQEVRTAA